MNKLSKITKIASLALTLALGAALAPAVALASTAETDLMLKVDDTQLSVTAPLTITYAMKADGTFVTPPAASVKITNNSIMSVAVKSFTVVPLANTAAVTQAGFQASAAKNAWWSTVAPNGGTAVDCGVSQASLGSAWNLAKAGASGAELQLATAGSMKAIDGIDFSGQQKLADITWTFGAAPNA